MPHMAKWNEKSQCVKHLAPRPVRFVLENSDTVEKVYLDFQDFINRTIQQEINRGLQYDQFVNIKEVPNG
jgi:hypothetical protein